MSNTPRTPKEIVSNICIGKPQPYLWQIVHKVGATPESFDRWDFYSGERYGKPLLIGSIFANTVKCQHFTNDHRLSGRFDDLCKELDRQIAEARALPVTVKAPPGRPPTAARRKAIEYALKEGIASAKARDQYFADEGIPPSAHQNKLWSDAWRRVVNKQRA